MKKQAGLRLSRIQMVGLFKWHSNTRPVGIQLLFDHSSARLAQYSDSVVKAYKGKTYTITAQEPSIDVTNPAKFVPTLMKPRTSQATRKMKNSP